jgi:4-alpha-glucanotransferase
MRRSGIVLHPTSLPGKCGIGDLGEWAYRFADFLSEGGITVWQVLPLGPPGYGNSPYQCFSSMAGNPLLISLEALLQEGWLAGSDLEGTEFPDGRVDFNAVIPFKYKLLRKAAGAFFERAQAHQRQEFESFCNEKSHWLDSFADFVALKQMNGGGCWAEWKQVRHPHSHLVMEQKFIQFEFFRQWLALKRTCNDMGIRIMGDIPIFVAHDSADVWASPEMFDLDDSGMPLHVAGVPPDYFSETGQLWGNPLYRWDEMERTGYRWWIERVHSVLELVDFVRIDHFRGFEKYWSIPAGAETAASGEWLEGPGDKLFSAFQKEFGKIPFIAEDLGHITPEVHELRDRWEFPGMRILQFAFGNESSTDYFKPYNFIPRCVVYTGTHDNDTTLGWFQTVDPGGTQTEEQMRSEREYALRYVQSDGSQIHWDFIRLAISSVAEDAIFPMQDVLGLGTEARMNKPASVARNWEWRLLPEQLRPELSSRLRMLNRTYGRLNT